MAAVGVVFMRHRGDRNQRRKSSPTTPGPAECTNAVAVASCLLDGGGVACKFITMIQIERTKLA